MKNLKSKNFFYYISIGLEVFNRLKIVRLVGGFVIFILSSIVLIVFGFIFFMNNIDQSYSDEQYKILIGAFTFTATLSGLLFRAKSSTKDEVKEKFFYQFAERFLHAAILFAIGTIFKFSLSQIENMRFPLANIVIFIVKTSASVSILYALIYSAVILSALNFILFEYKEDKK